MSEFITTLEKVFAENANSEIAKQQRAYMKNRFDFFGMKTPQRRELQKPFLQKQFLPEREEALEIVKTLWEKPQRDFHYVAQELFWKYKKELEEQDIELLEYMVAHQSWWDTVDFIAPKLMGDYFKLYPHQIQSHVDKWLASNHIWLQRSAILFQLKYKEATDTELLSYIVDSLLGSKEFFINKAIGWILRDYSRRNAEWVVEFVQRTNLQPLSKREALRLLDKPM